MQLPAPAKINRFLHIIRRRTDGRHDLATQFQFLEFSDTLHFAALPGADIRRIDRHNFELPAEDLCVRAAKLLQVAHPAAAQCGVAITLQKTIPPGSGLGGGSSDAATTLLALNHLWRLGLSRRRLADLGLQLGADVPVFIGGRAALAGGVGETLQPLDAAEGWLCLCLPSVVVSTARVFADPELRLRMQENKDERDGNDLEEITTRLHPEVGEALSQLGRLGAARMSGSGGAVFAEFPTRAAAERAAAQLPGGLNPRVARARNRHPLWDFS